GAPAGVDPATLDCRREPRRERGLRTHHAHAQGRGLRPGDEDPDRRPARHLRHARRRRAAHARPVLHVRRQAGRSRRVVVAALGRVARICMPSAAQASDGQVTITVGAKGVIECELVSSGERWGRGPKKDIHSSNKARVDSPAWHLVEALATLVSPDGNEPAIDGYGAKARALSASDKAMVATAARRLDEAVAKREMGVDHWVHDVSWVEALERLVSRPTVNIEGLVGGYTGPGGKTILPHRAVAKLDLRLVPDMTAAESLAALKAHL